MADTISSSGPLYSLPIGVKSLHTLIYSGNPSPSPAFLLPCRDHRLEPIPTPPCYSPVLRSTLREALFGGYISYLGIDPARRESLKRRTEMREILSLFEGEGDAK